MPLYEYQCKQCGSRYERIERASAPSDGVCTECGGIAHRLLGAPALKFKGSGWYVNDYGKGNGSRPNESDKPTPAAEDSKGTEKTEKKTETKKSEAKKSDAQVA